MAVLALLFLLLSARVIRSRTRSSVALGTGGVPELERAARVHANFAEYVPLVLLLLAMAELRSAPAWLLHGLAAALLLGRLLHAWGMSRAEEDIRFRGAGMVLTFTALGGAAVALLAF